MKRSTRILKKIKKNRWFTGQQPERKIASRPADKAVINWKSTSCQPRVSFPHPFTSIGVRLSLLLESRSGDVFSMLWRVQGVRPLGEQFC